MGSQKRFDKWTAGLLGAGVIVSAWFVHVPRTEASQPLAVYAEPVYSSLILVKQGALEEQSADGFMSSEFYGGSETLDLLKQLRQACARSDLRLTHETNSEDLDGNRSTSFYVNGDSHHYVVFYRYNRESTRLSKIRSLYGTDKDSHSPLIRTAGKLALVYVSSGSDKDKYNDRLEPIFDSLLKEMK
ncbi:hypothetical protein AWM70_05410 [Paenibacillus yonginensis]|uniref:Uncharacterized protein n=1 Tax=Paenibacillus yonginensis TaxID=1462996 RepID=A0A1B1MY26_9BACL|nr:hypothetical protein [Paenibacillus yonginensis]ANS74080.1 hypothetical protein AWM70_05410 [Paenibacillus yonginensis]